MDDILEILGLCCDGIGPRRQRQKSIIPLTIADSFMLAPGSILYRRQYHPGNRFP